jgi:hypothetical protein
MRPMCKFEDFLGEATAETVGWEVCTAIEFEAVAAAPDEDEVAAAWPEDY